MGLPGRAVRAEPEEKGGASGLQKNIQLVECILVDIPQRAAPLQQRGEILLPQKGDGPHIVLPGLLQSVVEKGFLLQLPDDLLHGVPDFLIGLHFGQIPHVPVLDGLVYIVEIPDAADKNHPAAGPPLFDLLIHGEPVHFRHMDVCEHNIHPDPFQSQKGF